MCSLTWQNWIVLYVLDCIGMYSSSRKSPGKGMVFHASKKAMIKLVCSRNNVFRRRKGRKRSEQGPKVLFATWIASCFGAWNGAWPFLRTLVFCPNSKSHRFDRYPKHQTRRWRGTQSLPHEELETCSLSRIRLARWRTGIVVDLPSEGVVQGRRWRGWACWKAASSCCR